MPEPGLGVDAN